ncbi:MAG: hypothetical protein JXQ73_17545 [Phycisphaerae bacterium]|nr:hypothetical protein [Phycisphaerae bacterium]
MYPRIFDVRIGAGCGPVALWMVALAGLLSGCDVPPHVQRTRDAPLFDDIIRIRAFIRPTPWLNFDPSDPKKIDGMAVNMYLESARLQKGVFGAGTIKVTMYEDTVGEKAATTTAPGASTRVTGKKLFEWNLSPEQAMPYRVVQRPERTYVMGDGYQLRLSWGDLDLSNRQVCVVLEYIRTDGRPVVRSPFHLRIPTPGQL